MLEKIKVGYPSTRVVECVQIKKKKKKLNFQLFVQASFRQLDIYSALLETVFKNSLKIYVSLDMYILYLYLLQIC